MRLTADNITVEGAVKGELSGSGNTRILKISNITNERVRVQLTNPSGFFITPFEDSVNVHIAPSEPVLSILIT